MYFISASVCINLVIPTFSALTDLLHEYYLVMKRVYQHNKAISKVMAMAGER